MSRKPPRIAAGYIRVSTDEQTEYSPDAQRKALKKWADANGYILPDQFLYADEGISGRKADKRPAFLSMIAAAKSKSHPFDVILVHKFDRFARSREDSVVYKALLRKECNVRVISVTESIEDDKFSIILEAMLEAMAEYYSINLADEVKKGMTEKALRGGRQCAASFGYRISGGQMVPDPEEAPLVREMFRRYLDGEGFYAIARDLSARGVHTHRGTPFENRNVEYILRNPVYIGKLRWNPAGKTCRNFDNTNIILADAAHAPLIDPGTWDAVQDRISSLKRLHPDHSRPSGDRKHWLSGIVRCARCGATLIYTNPGYFKCNNYIRGRCETSQHICAALLEQAFLERLRIDSNPSGRVCVSLIRKAEVHGEQKKALQSNLERAQKKLARLRGAYLAGAESVEEYADTKKSLDAEIAQIRSELSGLQLESAAGESPEQLRVRIGGALQTLCDPDVSIPEKYHACYAVVERCTFSKADATLSLTYRLSLDLAP